MPKKTKETDIEINKDPTKTVKITTIRKSKSTKSSVTSTKKNTATTTKKTSTDKSAKTATAKSATKKTTATSAKKNTKVATKKTSTKTTKSKKIKPAVANKVDVAKSSAKNALNFSPEYYDLPFRYNKTVVKILAQTPKNLFIYWEISDEDRENLKKQYGNYFFEITKPVLIVHNESMNYSFEVDVDDFANSWYLTINDSNCEYKVDLGRRPIPINYNYMPNYDIEKYGPIEPVKTPYIYISSSNELEAPNDRVLFNNTDKIYFKNVKTNEIIVKDIKDFQKIYKDGTFVNINEIYHKLYQNLYKDEIINENFDLNNPSSGNPSSGSLSSKFI